MMGKQLLQGLGNFSQDEVEHKTHSQMTVLLSKQNVAIGWSQGYGSGRLMAM